MTSRPEKRKYTKNYYILEPVKRRAERGWTYFLFFPHFSVDEKNELSAKLRDRRVKLSARVDRALPNCADHQMR